MAFRTLASVLSLASLSLPPLTSAASVSSTPAQTILGIGGSGAWWTLDLFHFPENVRQNLSNLLFSQDGLGISSYRWNVGGGGVGVNNPSRAPETFYLGPGVYNWSADPQGVYFLREASKRGVQDLTAFVNSAPAPLTSGKTSCGSSFVSGSGDAFAAYLADVVEHFRSEGVMINYVSPMNEPENSFPDCGQEGMLVLPNQRPEVINSLWNALDKKGLAGTVGILGDETSRLALAVLEYPLWLGSVKDKLAAISHHTYDYPSDAGYIAYKAFVNTFFSGKPTWMTEVCCSLGNPDGSGRGMTAGYDPTITNALLYAGFVFQSLVVGGEPHYDFWTLVSNQIGCSPLNNAACVETPNTSGWTDGVIYYDDEYATNGNFELYLTKHFWTYKHFGNFVKPGSQRLPISGDGSNNFMMAVQTTDKIFALVMNTSNDAKTLTLTFPQAVCGVASYRTSASEDFATLGPATNGGNGWTLQLDGLSLTTYEFNRAAC